MIRYVKTDAFPGIDDLAYALRKNLEQAQDGDTLVLPEGEHHISDRFCSQRVCWISNHDSGIRRVFCNLSGKENITIDGSGAKLIFYGRILPFFLENSRNITLKNFSVNYHRPFFTQGRVVENCDYGRLTLDIDPAVYPYRIENDHIVFEGDGWESSYIKWFIEMDPLTKDLVPSSEPDNYIGSRNIDLRARMVGKTLVEFRGAMRRKHQVGSVLCITHERRNNPGIAVSGCTGTTVEDVTIYHAGAMGLIAQNCRDTVLRRYRVLLPENTDRLMTANNDATHFVNCRGTLLMEDCILSNQHDDGSNIHGAYSIIAPGSSSHTLLLKNGHFQQEGVPLWEPGDELVTVDPVTMKRTDCRLRVVAAQMLNSQNFLVETELLSWKPPQTGHVVENLTAQPELTVRGCQFYRNRGRGILIDTAGKILIENNLFSTPGNAILHGYEASFWYESGPVQDVTIRENTFHRCAYVSGIRGTALRFCPGCGEGENPNPGTVEIIGNRFVSCGEQAVLARHMDRIILKDNRLSGRMPEPAWSFQSCREVLLNGKALPQEKDKEGEAAV